MRTKASGKALKKAHIDIEQQTGQDRLSQDKREPETNRNYPKVSKYIWERGPREMSLAWLRRRHSRDAANSKGFACVVSPAPPVSRQKREAFDGNVLLDDLPGSLSPRPEPQVVLKT